MSQLSYNYQTPKGIAGGLLDISPKEINSRINGETKSDTMKFGMGAVQGDIPGTDVKIPTAADTADKFEGLILTGHINQMNMSGEVKVYPKQTVGILRYGNAWARVAKDIEPSYGDPLYLVNDGAEAGLFTNDPTDAIEINGIFTGGLGTGNIAPVVIYNQKA